MYNSNTFSLSARLPEVILALLEANELTLAERERGGFGAVANVSASFFFNKSTYSFAAILKNISIE